MQVTTESQEVSNSPKQDAFSPAGPTALAKIVDFCEELKKQNEEVKKQLVEQHSVLEGLRSSLVAKAPPKAEKQASNAAAAKTGSKSRKSSKVLDAPHRKYTSAPTSAEAKTRSKTSEQATALRAPVVRARPLLRGDSKIPFPTSVASASARSTSETKESAITAQAEPKAIGARTPSLQKEEPAEHSLETPEEAASGSSAKDHEQFETPSRRRAPVSDDSEAETMSAEAKDDLWDDSQRSHAKFPREDRDRSDSDEPQVDQFVSKCCAADEDKESAEHEIEHTVSYLDVITNDGDDSDAPKCLNDDSELPLGGESKFVRCEDKAGEEISSCSSFMLVDDASSSLVSLDQSLGDLFQGL